MVEIYQNCGQQLGRQSCSAPLTLWQYLVVPAKLPLILLPPSEGKAAGGAGPAWCANNMAVPLETTRGLDARTVVMKALSAAMARNAAQRGKLLGVKGAALQSATEANRSLLLATTLPAIDRYTGVLYEAIEIGSLAAAAQRRMDRSVLIFSGLWGLLTPRDLIPDYKLKMGASLPRLGKLSTWWRPLLSPQLAAHAQGRRVWNLLPIEHNAAWTAPPQVPQISVKFFERRQDGSLVAVSHWNKFLKGALVRHLLEHPDCSPSSLEHWDHPSGYVLNPSLTEQRESVTVLAFVQN
ncbi:MAG: peroxide stress protein YaaA [Actinomycetes bacterium]